jgi:hypothetical protein
MAASTNLEIRVSGRRRVSPNTWYLDITQSSGTLSDTPKLTPEDVRSIETLALASEQASETLLANVRATPSTSPSPFAFLFGVSQGVEISCSTEKPNSYRLWLKQ